MSTQNVYTAYMLTHTHKHRQGTHGGTHTLHIHSHLRVLLQHLPLVGIGDDGGDVMVVAAGGGSGDVMVVMVTETVVIGDVMVVVWLYSGSSNGNVVVVDVLW